MVDDKRRDRRVVFERMRSKLVIMAGDACARETLPSEEVQPTRVPERRKRLAPRSEYVPRLAGRAAIVTGAASGIGEAIVRRLLAEGATVGAVDRDAERLGRVVSTWRAVLGKDAPVRETVADVAVPEQVASMVTSYERTIGGIDILVCNAGVEARGTVTEITAEEWDAVLSTNLTSVFLCARSVLPQMIARNQGTIINIASQLGIVGFPRFAAYNAAKGAVVNLTRNLALDYAPYNIRVNAIGPGPVDTPHLARSWAALPSGKRAEAQRWLEERIPLGRIGQPDEIAGGVAFLASDDATYVTGALLIMDGGYTAA